MDKLSVKSFLDNLVNLSNKFEKSVLFSWMCALTTFCIAKNLIKIITNVRILNFQMEKKYGSEWIIITDGCSQEVLSICINFLKLNRSYKFVLIGSSEYYLKLKIEEIKITHPETLIDFILYNYNEFHMEELNKKMSNIFHKHNIKHISVVVLNANFMVRKYFDKLNDSEIKRMMNYGRNDIAFASIINCHKVKDENFRTLVMSLANSLSVLALPTIQVYFSIKSMTDEYYMNLSGGGYDYVCCVEAGGYLPFKSFDLRFKLSRHSRTFNIDWMDYWRHKIMSVSKTYKYSYYYNHLVSIYPFYKNN